MLTHINLETAESHPNDKDRKRHTFAAHYSCSNYKFYFSKVLKK